MSSSSSSGINSNPVRDQQMLAVGRQCSHQSCHLVDFLPFKCQHCANSYCADHFKPASHSCPKYDEAKFNRVAPDCPLCNEPVPIPPGEDPNLRMERHLRIDCSVMTGRSQKASATPRCFRPKCGKLLFAPIQCDKCRQKFCPEHRFPNSHNCSSISTTVSPPTNAPIKPRSQSEAPAPSASGFAAFKRAGASSPPTSAPIKPRSQTEGPAPSASGFTAFKHAAASLKPPTSSHTKPSTIPPNNGTAPSSSVVASGSGSSTSHSKKIFSKAERRSKQERDSQIRAMRARAQRGLLSEDEKVILATLEAERARGSRDKDCVIM